MVPTAAQITEAAVNDDFDYLKGWCDDKWTWWQYSTSIVDEEGKTHRGDTCAGFDDYAYAQQEAEGNAKSSVDSLISLKEQTVLAEAWP
jgi:hypothetical protein